MPAISLSTPTVSVWQVVTPLAAAEQWVNDKKEGVSNRFKKSKFGKKVGAFTESAKEIYQAGKQWVEDKKEVVKDKYTKTVNKYRDWERKSSCDIGMVES